MLAFFEAQTFVHCANMRIWPEPWGEGGIINPSLGNLVIFSYTDPDGSPAERGICGGVWLHGCRCAQAAVSEHFFWVPCLFHRCPSVIIFGDF